MTLYVFEKYAIVRYDLADIHKWKTCRIDGQKINNCTTPDLTATHL